MYKHIQKQQITIKHTVNILLEILKHKNNTNEQMKNTKQKETRQKRPTCKNIKQRNKTNTIG